MANTFKDRLERLQQIIATQPLLNDICHGIEREGLRVSRDGRLSQLEHPSVLGKALTHPYITTDYSEALLEFITPVHCHIDDTLRFLEQVHQFTCQQLQKDDELLWAGSMPALLEGDELIPIAQYGSSNSGLMKVAYRNGLWHRYGKPMQTIAGVHYNFSLSANFWQLIHTERATESDKENLSEGYFSLIRNFLRHAWLLMYLFGASPAMSKSFFKEDSQLRVLQEWDAETLYLPYATSLRMSDLGYSNKAQSSLQICYNSVQEYIDGLSTAIHTPHAAYEAIGVKKNGEYLQLNSNILQIENEYYSTIRPKRVTRSGEKPITAIRNQGVEYVEVRCMDINPFEPLGIGSTDAHFLDIFLMYCALQTSCHIDELDFSDKVHNFKTAVLEGRKPGVMLQKQGEPIALIELGNELLAEMQPIAEILDTALNTTKFSASLQAQQAKIDDVTLTPSAKVLNAMLQDSLSHNDFMLKQSAEHTAYFAELALPEDRLVYFHELAKQSEVDQHNREVGNSRDFDTFLADYFAAE